MKLITGLLALIALSSFTVDAMASNDDYPGVHSNYDYMERT